MGLDQLNVRLMEYPAEIANPLSNFISHARVLLKRKMPMDQLLERVIDDKANIAGSELIDLYAEFDEHQSIVHQQYQQAMLLGTAVLVGLLFLYIA